jgi:TolB protein
VDLPQVCLTSSQWLELLEANVAPSEDLTGKLIAYGRIVDDGRPLSPDNAGVFVVDLTNGTRQILGPGTWPSLSEDGARAAYGGTDGLHIVDLASGDNRLVPGTLGSDYKPRWSPDGSQIAFIRTEDLNMYVVNIDGSDLRKVTDGPEYELLSEWLPDGSGLSYIVPTSEGLRLRFLDLSSGENRDGPPFDFSKQASAAISPDGQRIAFIGRIPGGMGTGLYLANLDGSDLRLIAGWDGWGGADPGWSPDGAWLIVTLSNADETNPLPIPALIHPETCQTVPLSGIEGNVQGWGP